MAEIKELKQKFSDVRVGKSGTEISSNQYRKEYITELQGTSGAEIFNKMRRNNPQIRKILSAIMSPIKNAMYSIPPISDEKADIEAASLMEKIIFDDGNFHGKLSEILSFLIHGFAIFEPITENVVTKEYGPITTLKSLALREAITIDEWEHDKETGELLRVHQLQTGDLEVDTWIDIEKLLIFFNEREGDDNGFSLLRPLYGPWKRQNFMETLKMVGLEKYAIPVPTIKTPKEIDPENDEEYAKAIEIIEAYCAGESSYLIYPEGWEIELFANGSFDPMKIEESIKREDEKMAGAILATFLELGTGGNSGAFSLSQNLEGFFTNVVNSFALNICDTINKKLIPFFMVSNFGDSVEIMPELKVTGITDKAGKEIMEIITGYASSNVITVDETLEDHVRRIHDLPKKAEGEIIDNQVSEGENADDSGENDNTDDNGVNNIDSGDSADPLDSGNIQASEVIKFKDTPRALIQSESEKVHSIMKSNIKKMGEQLIADYMRVYKNSNDSQKINTPSKVKVKGNAKYKRQLKGALTTMSTKALDMIQAELGVNTKLKNNEMLSRMIDKAYPNIKFQDDDFKKLPEHSKKLINMQADRISSKQAKDIDDRVAFVFMQVEQTTDSAAVIQEELENAVNDYSEANAIKTASVNVASTMVNQVRNDLMFEDEVLEQIYAFRFNNIDPKSPICQKLAGKVFAKNDNEFLRYAPPLHHNCKSYLSAVMETAKVKPEIKGLPPITEAEKKSITLGEYVKFLVSF